MTAKNRLAVLVGTAVAGMALLAGTAFACTNLATLNLSSASGSVGDTVTVTGSSFRVGTAKAPTIPVALSWNSADGARLADVTPDAAGNISATFTVPEGQAGYYVIFATQRDAKGVDAYGTPARAAFQILGANGESVIANPSTQTPVATSGSGNGILALTVGLGAAGLALFAAGFVSFARQARRREVPVAAKVRGSE
ncbi:MAG: hypothetical protein KY451_04875 [Actinobacteria bacterium]|nr:hypothetical protein [Actinomycetota bacterium]MBW3646528.1 hypothetical protein [Actinomycetota bacterium]